MSYRSRGMVIVWLLGFSAGCGWDREIDDLRRHLQATAAEGIHESEQWRQESEKWREGKGSLAAAAADFMQNGIGRAKNAADEVVTRAKEQMKELGQDLNAEAKLDADYIDARLRANFTAVRRALDRFEREYKTGKKPLIDDFKAFLDELAQQQEVEPKTAISVPREITLTWNSPDKKDGMSISNPSISISGFGFKQSSVKDKLRAVLVRDEKLTHPLSDVTVNSDFLITIDPRQEELAAVPDAERVRLYWDDQELHVVNVRWYRRPLAGPPNGDIALTLSYDGSEVKRIEPTQASFGITPSSAKLIRSTGAAEVIPLADSIDLTRIGLRGDDQRLELHWDQNDIAPDSRTKVLNFHGTRLPPHLREILLTAVSTRDDKDREIEFSYTAHFPGRGAIGAIAVGRGQVWKDPGEQQFRIPIDASDESKRLYSANKRSFQLRVHYDSSDGDPRWIGKLRVAGTLVDGSPINLILETAEFEMGHHDGGRRRENIEREFPFDAP